MLVRYILRNELALNGDIKDNRSNLGYPARGLDEHIEMVEQGLRVHQPRSNASARAALS